MKIINLPGIAVGTTIGLGTAAATAKDKDDAYTRGVALGLGGALLGSKSKWMQEAGSSLGKSTKQKALSIITPKSIIKDNIKIPENVKKELSENIAKTIKKPGIALGKATKFVGKSMVKALASLGTKKGILALGIL